MGSQIFVQLLFWILDVHFGNLHVVLTKLATHVDLPLKRVFSCPNDVEELAQDLVLNFSLPVGTVWVGETMVL